MTRHHSCRVSPFGHPRITARLTAPRGISQPPTSFIGSQCQGIHHAPLNTYNTKPKNEFFRKIAHQHTQQQPTPEGPSHTSCALDARNHYPQIKHHTPPPKMEQQHADTHQRRCHPHQRGTGLLSQSPIVCSAVSSPTNPSPAKRLSLHPPDTHYRPWLTYPNRTTAHDHADDGGIESVLLRKEVIQPHLPVRLPCYDFVPIASPTFDHSLTRLGRGLRVLPTFMT